MARDEQRRGVTRTGRGRGPGGGRIPADAGELGVGQCGAGRDLTESGPGPLDEGAADQENGDITRSAALAAVVGTHGSDSTGQEPVALHFRKRLGVGCLRLGWMSPTSSAISAIHPEAST